MRADVGELAGTKSSRAHFNAELDSRRLTLLQTLADLPIESFVVICRRRHGVTEFEARSRCLTYIVGALQDGGMDLRKAMLMCIVGGATSILLLLWMGPETRGRELGESA